MPPKTIRKAIADTLEDLKKDDFKKFCRQLLDRREEPTVRRNKVEGKDFLEVTDVLVSTFTETGALAVTLEILREIDCRWEREKLERETSAQSSTNGSSDTATPSDAATGGNTPGGGGGVGTDEHFVDQHRVQLIKRVRYVPPILDDLLQKGVMNQGVYNKIMALPTSEDKMRELYLGPLQGGEACKDVFLTSLEDNERFLVAELKRKK